MALIKRFKWILVILVSLITLVCILGYYHLHGSKSFQFIGKNDEVFSVTHPATWRMSEITSYEPNVYHSRLHVLRGNSCMSDGSKVISFELNYTEGKPEDDIRKLSESSRTIHGLRKAEEIRLGDNDYLFYAASHPGSSRDPFYGTYITSSNNILLKIDVEPTYCADDYDSVTGQKIREVIESINFNQ